ncbi:MAG: capsule biosynthesis protein CapC [Dethiosulfovibrio peptidovorans]|nr:MAG: capsule biosynthesis protein CapC [Dethiosulfovibrio peptidovorans]
MIESSLWRLLLGIGLGMLLYRQTGLSCGGIITPGVLAVSLTVPMEIVWTFTAAGAIWLVLEGLSRVTVLYGRQRMAVSMGLAVLFRLIIGGLGDPMGVWLGWAVPGLVAADFQRQGPLVTVAASVSTAAATAMAFSLFVALKEAVL